MLFFDCFIFNFYHIYSSHCQYTFASKYFTFILMVKLIEWDVSTKPRSTLIEVNWACNVTVGRENVNVFSVTWLTLLASLQKWLPGWQCQTWMAREEKRWNLLVWFQLVTDTKDLSLMGNSLDQALGKKDFPVVFIIKHVSCKWRRENKTI